MADQNDMREAILRTLSGENLPPDAPYGTGIGEINRRYSEMGPVRRGLASLANVAQSLPIIRSMSFVDHISTPSDLEISRAARPGLSKLENLFGHSAPFIALGAGAPALFSSLPRVAISSMALEGTDAGLMGENVPQAMANAALSSIPGPVLNKMLVPRTPQQAFNARLNTAIQNVRDARAAARDVGASFPPWSGSAMARLNRTLPEDAANAYRDTVRSGINYTRPRTSFTDMYLNNQILNQEQQSLLNALMSPYTQETISGR